MLDYNNIEKKVLLDIKNIRNDYYNDSDNIPIAGKEAMNSSLFDFTCKNHQCYEFVLHEVNNRINRMLENIVVSLFTHRGIHVSTNFIVKTSNNLHPKRLMKLFDIYKAQPLFLIVKEENNEPILYWFKYFGLDNVLPDDVVTEVLRPIGIKKFRYITLVEQCAFAEILDYNDNFTEDKGTNRYSFKKFFEESFGIEEYATFKEFESRLTVKIKDYLGLSIIKSLTPNALFSFKKIVEDQIKKYEYTKILYDNESFTEVEIDILKKQYFDMKYFKALVNEGDFNSRFGIEGCQFSESFLTAEWLYQSLDSIGKIDLAVIAMGYFKAIEEVLFVFISAHSDEQKRIDTYNRPDDWKNIPINKRVWQIIVTKTNLKKKKKYIMLERMINFLSDYDDLFNNTATRNYLIKRLHAAQELRNGYFHKDNMSEMAKVCEARDHAFVIFFILFGGMTINETGKKTLGIPAEDIQYHMLCEYVNCHSSKAYYYGTNENSLELAIGQRDQEVQYDQNGNAKYTGVYFKHLVGFPESKNILFLQEANSIPKENVHFLESTLPKKIYTGPFIACAQGFDLSGCKKLIWDNGVFLG